MHPRLQHTEKGVAAMEEKQRRAEVQREVPKTVRLKQENVRNVVIPEENNKETFPAGRHPIAS
jgi:hypothetical protein